MADDFCFYFDGEAGRKVSMLTLFDFID